VITDFGSDVAFGKIPKKMMEHHGISIPISAGQEITESHAQHILERQSWETEISAIEGVEFLIAEMDGTMIPIVETKASETDGEEVDRRKTRKISWKEARLTSARIPEGCDLNIIQLLGGNRKPILIEIVPELLPTSRS
jgi:hypothetical protein